MPFLVPIANSQWPSSQIARGQVLEPKTFSMYDQGSRFVRGSKGSFKNNTNLVQHLFFSFFSSSFHQQKHPLRWLKTGWVVGEFVDVTRMWVNLFHFCWRWVKIDIFTLFDVAFSPTFFSPTCRFHLLADFTYLKISFSPTSFSCFTHLRFDQLVDFVFTHFFSPFHPLADFTYL